MNSNYAKIPTCLRPNSQRGANELVDAYTNGSFLVRFGSISGEFSGAIAGMVVSRSGVVEPKYLNRTKKVVPTHTQIVPKLGHKSGHIRSVT